MMLAAAWGMVFSGVARAQENPPPNPLPQGGRAGGLLVVTPKRFEAAVAPYVAFKKERRAVEVAVLENVLAKTEGVDDPERLKRFVFEAWKSRGVKFVLLVGDADVIPVRYMCLDRVTAAAFDYAFYPSDLYYADVAKRDGSFEDWNGNKEGFHAGYFGEVRGEKNKSDPMNFDGIDYKPEVAVGRWPVSSAAQLKIVMEKSEAYERGRGEAGKGDTGKDRQEKGAGDEGWQSGVSASPFPASPRPDPTRVLAIMTGGWVDMRGRLDSIVSTLPKEWKTSKLYYSDGNAAFATEPPDEGHVVAGLNGGSGGWPRLVLHVGHGADDQWAGCFSLHSLKKVENAGHLPVVLSAGCSTARFATLPPYEAYVDVNGRPHVGTDAGEVFDAPPPPPSCYATGPYNKTGLGEQLVVGGPNGAIAYIGCNTGSQPCGVTLLEGFAAAVGKAGGKGTIGECWMEAESYYFDHEHLATLKPSPDWYPASIFFQGMKFMLYGDPSLGVGE